MVQAFQVARGRAWDGRSTSAHTPGSSRRGLDGARSPSADAVSPSSRNLPLFSWPSVWVYQDQRRWREGLGLLREDRGGAVAGGGRPTAGACVTVPEPQEALPDGHARGCVVLVNAEAMCLLLVSAPHLHLLSGGSPLRCVWFELQ